MRTNHLKINTGLSQTCNQEFSREEEVTLKKGTSINIYSATHEIKSPQGKILEIVF